MRLPRNVEGVERIVRIIGGLAIFYLLFFTGSKLLPVQTMIASLSLYPVVTGVFGRCVLYAICGVSTYDAGDEDGDTNAPVRPLAPRAERHAEERDQAPRAA